MPWEKSSGFDTSISTLPARFSAPPALQDLERTPPLVALTTSSPLSRREAKLPTDLVVSIQPHGQRRAAPRVGLSAGQRRLGVAGAEDHLVARGREACGEGRPTGPVPRTAIFIRCLPEGTEQTGLVYRCPKGSRQICLYARQRQTSLCTICACRRRRDLIKPYRHTPHGCRRDRILDAAFRLFYAVACARWGWTPSLPSRVWRRPRSIGTSRPRTT